MKTTRSAMPRQKAKPTTTTGDTVVLLPGESSRLHTCMMGILDHLEAERNQRRKAKQTVTRESAAIGLVVDALDVYYRNLT